MWIAIWEYTLSSIRHRMNFTTESAMVLQEEPTGGYGNFKLTNKKNKRKSQKMDKG